MKAPQRHQINDSPHEEGYILCIRCTCGSLLVASTLGLIQRTDVETAFDKHLIGILEAQWVKQFYQEA